MKTAKKILPMTLLLALTACSNSDELQSQRDNSAPNINSLPIDLGIAYTPPERDPARPPSIRKSNPTNLEKYGSGVDMFKHSMQGINVLDVGRVAEELDKRGIGLSSGAVQVATANSQLGKSAVESIVAIQEPKSSYPRKSPYDKPERRKEPKDVYRNKCTKNDKLIKVQFFTVSDGDTVYVTDWQGEVEGVNLVGVDAPELKQPFGDKAKASLKHCLAYDDNIIVEWRERDSDGNILGKISNTEFEDCGLYLLSIGEAWHDKDSEYKQYEYDRVLYSNAELQSRMRGHGLWANKNNVAPWDFRANKRRYSIPMKNEMYDYNEASCTLDGISTAPTKK